MTPPVHEPPPAKGAPPLTVHPYIGVLGVFLGAATSTLNGRLLSVGLPDLRGALGFGFDEASWIPTVLNMGMMFIGVFAVFLGTAYGIRRVLLITGAVFTLTSFLLPFSSSLAAMLTLEAIAGLSAGAFYTLTLTFVVRNLPKKLLLFGVAAYALDIVVTSNVAALIEGWYIDHLSWHWIFWTAAFLTPAHDGVHLFRSSASRQRTAAELARIPLHERGTEPRIWRTRPGAAPGLVEIGRIRRHADRRHLSSAGHAGPAILPAQSPGQPSVSQRSQRRDYGIGRIHHTVRAAHAARGNPWLSG